MIASTRKSADVSDRRSFAPIERVFWVLIVCASLLIIVLPLPPADQQQAILILVSVTAYTLFFFHWLVPRYGARWWLHAVATTANVGLLAFAHYMLGYYAVLIDAFYVIVVVIAATTAGWPVAILAAILSVVAEVALMLRQTPLAASDVTIVALRAIIYLSAGYLASSQAAMVRRQAAEVAKRNTELAFLLNTSEITMSSLDMESVLPRLADKVASGLPATFCRICLLDRHRDALVTKGIHPVRSLSGWEGFTGESWSLQSVPTLREKLDMAKTTILRVEDLSLINAEEERALLFPDDVKSLCAVPIVSEGKLLGVILVGEARSWQREPFDGRKIELLQTLAAQLGMVMQNAELHQATQRQTDRLAVLVEVARAVGSTLEIDDLLDLIHQQLSQAIPSDSYFVALYDKNEGMLDMRMLIDEGQRYPPQRIPLGEGLATWVVLKRQPLLVRHLSEELDSMPVRPVIVGQPKTSESWLGVPMMTSEGILGLLAVASYQPYAFDNDDQALLTTVARQAALALDNARHHAQVRDQARRDSLTGVYNHGYLLTCLREQIEKCTKQQCPLSMIMLDIDRFKRYNDQYGHTIGDEVLKLTAQAIRTHVKKTDAVGRWGGEEFAVVLPGATTAEARDVAERIRQTLLTMPLSDTNGRSIPKPTVSQGIATFPDHVSTAEDLVVLADRMLYQAKEAGRDMVKVAGSDQRVLQDRPATGFMT